MRQSILVVFVLLLANVNPFIVRAQSSLPAEIQRQIDARKLEREVQMDVWLSKQFVVVRMPQHLNPGETGRIWIELRRLPAPFMLGGSKGYVPPAPGELSFGVQFERPVRGSQVRATLTASGQALDLILRSNEIQSTETAGWAWDVTPRRSLNYKLTFDLTQLDVNGKERQVLQTNDISLNATADLYFYLGRISSWVYLALIMGFVGLYILVFGRKRGWFHFKWLDPVARAVIVAIGNVEPDRRGPP
jgi:hypothetical protein